MHIEKRVLVTGGAGFLGSHLCERLLVEGAYVICVDNFYTGTHRNIEHLSGKRNFELIRHDVTFPLYIEVDEIYIGSPQESAILELVNAVIDLTGSRSKIVRRPLAEDDPSQRRSDISKAQRMLNWAPRVPLRDGLKKTIAYFDELLLLPHVQSALGSNK